MVSLYKLKRAIKIFQIIDQTCDDGLVFDESSIQFAKCSFPFSVDCTDRQLLQTPKSKNPRCPRLNGYFPHEDPKVGSTKSGLISGDMITNWTAAGL